MCKCNCPEEAPGCRRICPTGIAEAKKRAERTERIRTEKAKQRDADTFKYESMHLTTGKKGCQL